MKRKYPSGREFFKKSDVIVAAAFVVAALAVWAVLFSGFAGGQAIAEIYSGDRLIQRIPLPAADQTIQIPDKQLVLELKNNQIGVLTTDCPDKTCQRSGYIGRPGQSIVCLPNRVSVQIIGLKQPDQPGVDAVTG